MMTQHEKLEEKLDLMDKVYLAIFLSFFLSTAISTRSVVGVVKTEKKKKQKKNTVTALSLLPAGPLRHVLGKHVRPRPL